jgi:DNA-binding NtrC family response regulator
MQRVRLQVRRIGPHFRTILVSGEPGTGKELVARALHALSPGAQEPFVVCPAAGFESVLNDCEGSAGPAAQMGHSIKRSLRGTLYLEAISEVPLEVQDHLLQVLKEYEWAQNRFDAPQKMDLRMVASTTEDLRILVSTGRFRQELYQRLATVDISLPPLREHMEDLPELATCFLSRFAALDGTGVGEIGEEAIERMQKYRWPGNVSELERVLRSGVQQSKGAILASHHLPAFPHANESPSVPVSDGDSMRLQDVVQQHVVRVLKACEGNKLRAAELLGISRSTLYRMLDNCSQVDALR